MLGFKVRLRSAEALRKYLKKRGLLESSYRVLSSNSFIYFPLSSRPDADAIRKAKEFGGSLVDMGFRGRGNRMHPVPRFTGKAARGYDLYGNIAVIEAEPRVARKLALAIMRTNRHIETVLRKGGAVTGRYRTRRFVYVAGNKTYIATYRENGCVFRFDIRKVFFSARLAYERKRISGLAKNGEKVVVMFAGVGPYAVEIAKEHPACKVIAIELNKSACKYMRDNAVMNKTANVMVEEGDANRLSSKYKGFADRIIMPLPKDSSSFLGAALRMCKSRCMIHYYAFCKADEVKLVSEQLADFFLRNQRRCRIIDQRIVRPYSSTEVEMVFDLRVD